MLLNTHQHAHIAYIVWFFFLFTYLKNLTNWSNMMNVFEIFEAKVRELRPLLENWTMLDEFHFAKGTFLVRKKSRRKQAKSNPMGENIFFSCCALREFPMLPLKILFECACMMFQCFFVIWNDFFVDLT